MTIIRRKGAYGVKVWDGYGKRYRWIGTFASEAEARAAEADASLKPGQEMPTVEQWGRVWLSDYPRAAPATQLVYREAVKRIIKDLGSAKLSAIDRQAARKQALDWPRNVSAVARTMWADAKRDGICKENPWTDMRLKQSRGRKDYVALSEGELLDLADVAQSVHREYGPEARAIILTLGYVGIRPGELCALRWDDLDLADLEMTIKASLDATGVEKAPKNGKARRVTIPPMALEAIRSLPRSTDPYVFHSYKGRRLRKANLWYLWRAIKVVWELEHAPMDLYSLRHTAATIALERGLDAATVAVQLGHEDGGALILSRYGHPSQDRARERLKMAYSTIHVRNGDRRKERNG